MTRIDELNITVSIEGDAAEGERAFARLYDKYSRVEHERRARQGDQAASLARARSLSAQGRS